MALLDDLLRSVLAPPQGPGQPQVSRSQASGLAEAVIAMLNDPRVGGIEGLMRRFQQSGLDDVIRSWIGTGQNRPVAPDQLERALGRDDLGRLSERAGVKPQQGSSILAVLLPVLIDRLTPDGQVPQQPQLAQRGPDVLKSLLG
jgi:uncharacterized protein YidB (DUF937 family)